MSEIDAVHVVIVSAGRTAAHAWLTVQSVAATMPGALIHVLDVDGAYRASTTERVLSPGEIGVTATALHLRAVILGPDRLCASLEPALVRAIFTGAQDPESATVVVMRPGVLLLNSPTGLVSAARLQGLSLISRASRLTAADGRWPGHRDLLTRGSYAPELLAMHGPSPELIDLWERTALADGGPFDRWLELAAASTDHHTLHGPAELLSFWNLDPGQDIRWADEGGHHLYLDGAPVVALDLTQLDPERPWILSSEAHQRPRGRLSDHPVLAEVVQSAGAEILAQHDVTRDRHRGAWDLETTSLGTVVDPALRALYRAIDLNAPSTESPDVETPPDPFDPGARETLLDWLTKPPARTGIGPYLLAIHRDRLDLQRTFPNVPGEHAEGFLHWAGLHGVAEGYAPAVIEEGVRRALAARHESHRRPPPGVNVIGYLRGELGIGESARLMVAALVAAGVPHETVPVEQHLLSRQQHSPTSSRPPLAQHFDTSLICVNADLTGSVAASVPDVLARSYRIGMWYWEVEDFPVSQHEGFAHVDEIWVATDFVRRAIEPHSPVPVRTVTPPLPQRRSVPTVTRQDLGLPDRPLFLFSFDYLSTAERKNPLGLLEAFTTAFRPGEGPVLVIKSINSDRRPSEAEQLRLRAAATPDVLLLEEYLDADARDALVALCDVYVSLHRSEGLGLTMAEAMAWGKPVIATAYSGNLQFMTDENSFLVPWTPTPIPPGADPYPAGGVWADPDLGAAAALMRMVVDQPDVAAARGARAAADIAALHSPEVAGARIAARLTETAARRRARSRMTVAARLHNAARQARSSLT